MISRNYPGLDPLKLILVDAQAVFCLPPGQAMELFRKILNPDCLLTASSLQSTRPHARSAMEIDLQRFQLWFKPATDSTCEVKDSQRSNSGNLFPFDNSFNLIMEFFE